MTWFKVDDSFYSHPKTMVTDPAALGLWVVAGSWSSAHLTEGFVRDDVLPRLLPDAAELAKKLVAAGLWTRKRGGYQFHDWLDQNPSKDAVKRERELKAARQKRWRERKSGASVDASRDGTRDGAPPRPAPKEAGAGTPPKRQAAAATPPGGRTSRQTDLRQLAIANCTLCDNHGYAGTRVCDHDPTATERAARGSALVREALGAKP